MPHIHWEWAVFNKTVGNIDYYTCVKCQRSLETGRYAKKLSTPTGKKSNVNPNHAGSKSHIERKPAMRINQFIYRNKQNRYKDS